MDHQQFQELIDQVKQGCPDATQTFVENYEEFVLAVVRPRMSQQLRRSHDSQDIVQFVWLSFFNDKLGKRMFGSPEELAAFLRKVAKNKVYDCYQQRRMTPEKPDNSKVEKLLDHPSKLLDDNGTASQKVMAQENIDSTVSSQSPHHQYIFSLFQRGYGYEEIAHHVGLTPRHVRYILDAIENNISLN